MLIIYGICTFILGSSSVMIGYVWIRDIKNTKAQAANAEKQGSEDLEDIKANEEIITDYPNLIKKTA